MRVGWTAKSVTEGVWVTRSGASGAKEGARRAAREARPWIERVARFGYAAYKAKFGGELALGRMGEAREVWTTLLGRIGTAARALAIGAAGAFLILAAYQSDPKETRGLGGALETIQHQPLGSYMLGAMAVGLVLYGAFMFLVARYRYIDTS